MLGHVIDSSAGVGNCFRFTTAARIKTSPVKTLPILLHLLLRRPQQPVSAAWPAAPLFWPGRSAVTCRKLLLIIGFFSRRKCE